MVPVVLLVGMLPICEVGLEVPVNIGTVATVPLPVTVCAAAQTTMNAIVIPIKIALVFIVLDPFHRNVIVLDLHMS